MNLTRDTKTFAETLGKFTYGSTTVDCIEQPDNHDIPEHSSAPLGTYTAVPHTSAHLHEDDGVTPLRTWAFVNPLLGVTHSIDDPVPGGIGYPHRAEFLLHPANFARELKMCIAPGDSRKKPLGFPYWMVTDSRATFKAIRDYLDAHPEDRTLTITETL